MKVAILHDYLNQYGGAERVLESFLEIFPDADVYTLLYDKEKTLGRFEKNVRGVSLLDRKFIRRNHRLFIPLMPIFANLMRASEEYDIVISLSAGYAKGFRVKAPFHICYCHTPLRYAWEIDYLKNLSFPPKLMTQFVAYPIARALREWDKNASANVNIFLAVSNFIARKISAYYGREADVIYPPVDISTFYPETRPSGPTEDYYLMVGRLLYYKLFDLGIKAFNKLGLPLKIVGSGPEEKKLKKIAGPNIEFISHINDNELRRLYSNAKAFIFPQIEDFGLVAAEAQACGLPVIAYNQGGGTEIIEEGKTGIFFNEQNVESLIKAVKDMERMRFNRTYIAKRARRFSKERFKEEIKKVMGSHGFIV